MKRGKNSMDIKVGDYNYTQDIRDWRRKHGGSPFIHRIGVPNAWKGRKCSDEPDSSAKDVKLPPHKKTGGQ